MKYKNYLCRKTGGGFFLARGTLLEDDNSLAVVKAWSEDILPKYSIIDVASGLFVCQGTSKRKVLELWKQKKEDAYALDAIKMARLSRIYPQRVIELNDEKKIWRQSGYEL